MAFFIFLDLMPGNLLGNNVLWKMLPQETMTGSVYWELPSWLSGKASACKCGRPSSIPGLGRLLEEGMASHSSILAWRIPWTEEPGGLQSMGLQRVRHN